MRATVAPCIEAVIVLDRLLFLRESVSLHAHACDALRLNLELYIIVCICMCSTVRISNTRT